MMSESTKEAVLHYAVIFRDFQGLILVFVVLCAIVLVCAILVVALQLLHAPPQHKQAKPKWLRERARTIPGHHHTKMLAKRRRELSARSTGFNWKLAVPAYIDQWTKQLPRRSQERDRARPGREVSLHAHFDGTFEDGLHQCLQSCTHCASPAACRLPEQIWLANGQKKQCETAETSW